MLLYAKEVGDHLPITETCASKNGVNLSAGNGSNIENFGQSAFDGVTGEGHEVILPMQVVEVVKVLAAVDHMVDKGNRVVFDSEESYIENKESGKRTGMKREGGAFVFSI